MLGTRPEAIKLAPVHRALGADGRFEVRLVSTGQHREMLASALTSFGLRPDHDLDLMRADQQQAELVSAMIPGVARVLREERPACVVVQGDTCSTLAGAFAAFLERIPVAHVEAGLRTGDRYSPFPEEMYRSLVGRLADFHFAPTPTAAENLRKEGVPAASIHVTGNTAIDALRLALARPVSATSLSTMPQLQRALGKRYVLITCHRRESFGDDLAEIMAAFRDLAEAHPGTDFVFPVHLNPNVGAAVQARLADLPNLLLLSPLDYAAFAHVLAGAFFVMTDSGGIQEECADLGIPVLVLRRHTERAEGVAAGPALLVGVERGAIRETANRLLTDVAFHQAHAVRSAVFGDGSAARRIRDVLAVALP